MRNWSTTLYTRMPRTATRNEEEFDWCGSGSFACHSLWSIFCSFRHLWTPVETQWRVWRINILSQNVFKILRRVQASLEKWKRRYPTPKSGAVGGSLFHGTANYTIFGVPEENFIHVCEPSKIHTENHLWHARHAGARSASVIFLSYPWVPEVMEDAWKQISVEYEHLRNTQLHISLSFTSDCG